VSDVVRPASVRPAFWALGHNSRCSLMKPLIRPLVKNLSDQLGSYLAGCLLISSATQIKDLLSRLYPSCIITEQQQGSCSELT